MSASTGAHRGSAPDANWSYALEAHIAWAAAGAPKAALKAQANPKGGKCIMEYDMDESGFIDLNECPQNTLFNFPKEIIKETNAFSFNEK